jgi:hypothetical protein
MGDFSIPCIVLPVLAQVVENVVVDIVAVEASSRN